MSTTPVTPAVDLRAALVDLFDLSGKTAWLPGGYGGLGEAIAWGLASRGASVVISGRNADKAAALVGQLREAGHNAAAVPMDVHAVAEINAAADAAAECFGGLEILVNCIGIQIEQPLLEVTEHDFDAVYQTNLKGAMFLAQAAARHQMAARGGDGRTWGRQVHLLSVRSQLGIRNRGYSAYCSTKGGMALLIKQHAVELAPHGITVNGVAPTFVYTELIRYIVEDPAYHDALVSRIPLGRIADPTDIVSPTLFFCTPGADFVTGQVLYVDGGITASQ